MASYGAPNQFDETEMAQFQEEIRRRQHQVLQAGSGIATPAMALSAGRMRPPDAYFIPHHPDVTNPQASSPYVYPTGQPHHASPYGRVSNPYAAMDAAHAYAQSHGGLSGTPHTASSDSVAQLYATQQRRAQVAGAYGYNGGVTTSRTALEQHYANYGMVSTPSSMMYYGHENPYPTASQDASMHQQQYQHPPNAYARPAPKTVSSSSYQSPNDGESGRDEDKFDSPEDSSSIAKTPKSPNSKEKSKQRMLQKVTTTYTNMKTSARAVEKDGLTVIEDGDDIWYTGSVPLGVEDDKYWLSELQVYLRSNFAEAFDATEDDIAAPMHGRNKPIALGQVGIRCIHCKQENPAERGQQATSYPSLISGIYNSVQQMLRLHLDCCLSMPQEVRSKIESLKISCSSRGGRKQYWIDSARRLGLVDTPHGIHFGRNPLGPLPPLSGPSVNSKEGRIKKRNPQKALTSQKTTEAEPVHEDMFPPPLPVDNRPLVFAEDEPLISDYLYLTLQQMAPCILMEADRVGCYKTRKVGFAGLACRHCVGQAGCGRYFPASEASLSQTTTSQTIMNHVRNCRRCPIEIRENLEMMKRSRMGPDGKRSLKPKHGGRKVFFHRLWCRIQNIPFDDNIAELKERKKKKSKRSSPRKRRSDDGDGIGSDEEETDEEEEDADDTDSMEEDSEEEDLDLEVKPATKKVATPTKAKKMSSPWVHGCVRLTKSDDPHWLSEMECFARSDLVEVFSVREEDIQDYVGRSKPGVGQVGIRCTFCKSLDPSDRLSNCVYFPDSLSSIHTKVFDMFRLHCPNCPSMPTQTKVMVKSFKGFDAKVMNDDSQQYWVDSARDLGLSNVPPEGLDVPGAWGITFRKDPLEPSPADELDLEQTNGGSVDLGKNCLIKEEDWGTCTDQVMLLLRQVRPCCFRKNDRRAGPGSRGRDRTIGFPGICCIHCAGRNSLGRYFPVNAKNLMDNTFPSLQTHIATCVHCPESIKASVAYLSHRTILQRAELSGSWKKTFFQKIWDRLHDQREWTSIDDEVPDRMEEDDAAADEEAEEINEIEEGDDDDDDDVAEDHNEEKDGEDDGDEESGNPQMNALIKAAAIWLTNQDAATDGKGATRSAKGRPLPGKRNAAGAESEPPSSSTKEGAKKRKARK